ncbi:protein TIC 20-v, chloroplastic isoform X2 [Phalaenopsis equestris]|uniref:protein TIC 20-v, chloroplastic isoform X2 n=1 Tax=Phalaenopsis equestris TaxID=78828 RepID=UPI0009E34790|nr:protein TIC 20-v, chloroplastic isoform X2 [Phalaenopsis equestris]
MATSSSTLLSTFSPSNLSYNQLRPHLPLFLLPHCHQIRHRRLLTPIQNRRNGGGEPPDRLISAVCYLYPFLDGVHFGRFLLAQFPPIQLIIFPFAPAIRLFRASPLNPILIFLTLYFAVVRNPSSFSRYVRFNTMQAIVLDVLLIFPDLIERFLAPRDGVGLDIVMSIDSTVFLFLLVSLIYGSTTCLLGQVPRLPIVADAADRQIIGI